MKPIDEPLHYIWCEGGCSSIDNWYGYALGLAENDAEHPALVLDDRQSPRIAYKDAIALPPGCIDHFWFGGFRPSLALAYDVESSRRCYHNPQQPALGHFIERLWWTSRFGLMNHPGSPIPNEPGAKVPEGFSLGAANPNPIHTSTVIRFELPAAGPARMTVYDLLGREIAVLTDGVLPAGLHQATIDASGLAPGLCVVKLDADGMSAVGTVMVTH